MIWLLLALGTGFCVATQGALAKRLMADLDPRLLVWVSSALAAPVLAMDLAAQGEALPDPPPVFWLYLLLGVGLLLVANTLYFKALHAGELSRDLPLLSLTPVLMTVTSRVMVGQRIGRTGLLAVLLVTVGCFLLQGRRGMGLGETLRAFAREPGSRLMLAVAVIWSVTANLDKLCVDGVGPRWYPLLAHIAFALLYLPWLLRGRVSPLRALRRMPLALAAVGFLQALASLTQMASVKLAPHVAYVITLKRGGLMLFGLAWGALCFRERNLGRRLVGAAWILAGLALLASQAGGE